MKVILCDWLMNTNIYQQAWVTGIYKTTVIIIKNRPGFFHLLHRQAMATISAKFAVFISPDSGLLKVSCRVKCADSGDFKSILPGHKFGVTANFAVNFTVSGLMKVILPGQIPGIRRYDLAGSNPVSSQDLRTFPRPG